MYVTWCDVHVISVCVVVTIRCGLLLCFVYSAGYSDMERKRERKEGKEKDDKKIHIQHVNAAVHVPMHAILEK